MSSVGAAVKSAWANMKSAGQRLSSRKQWTRRTGKWLTGFLALIMILGLSMTPEAPLADAVDDTTGLAMASSMPSVIWNYPANTGTTKQIALDQMTWNKSGIHSYYDKAYTTATSKDNNGTATPDHMVLSRTAIRFIGYGMDRNLDVLWTNAYSSFQTLDFTFDATLAKMHTLNQTGILFNGSFGGAGNAYYTGYALVLDATAQVANNQTGTASFKLVYINNQLLSTTGLNTFPPQGISFATQDTIIPTIVEGQTPSFHVQLVRTATGFDLYIDGNLVREVDPAQNMNLPGLGFFAGYYSHNCPVLTVVNFSNVALAVNVGSATTSPKVMFVNKDTGTEIAPAQTVPSNASVSYADDEFLVDASLVQTITDAAGNDYAYAGASVSNLNHITYKAGGAANNTVILYYKDPTLLPQKHASVNGLEEPTTAAAPVTVNQGDIIDYRIDVKAAHPAPAPPIVYGGTGPAALPLTSLTTSQSGYVGTTGSTATSYAGTGLAAYPNGINYLSAASPPFLQAILRHQYTGPTNSSPQHYLWLTTNGNLPKGSYTVTITAAADARTWGSATENSASSPVTTVTAFMKGIVGGASALSPGTYSKPGGYNTFSDQIFPATSGKSNGITFRSGPAGTLGVNANDTRMSLDTVNSNTTPFPTTETSTFQSPLVLGSDQPAVIGLVMGATLGGNTQSSAEHYTSLIRVFKIEFTPLGPPPAPYAVSDLLPEGITLAEDLPNYWTVSSTADPTYTGADATFKTGVDADTNRQQLDWSFPNVPGDISIHVKARVTASSGIFENSALVTNLSAPVVVPDQTNSTWHKTAVAKVTERYVNVLTGETLHDDTYTWLPEGGGYGVAPALLAPIAVGSKTFRYWAYLPDDGAATPLNGAPPDGQPIPDPNGDGSGDVLAHDNLYDPVYGNDRVVILYFIPDVQVTIISMDHGVVVRPSTNRTPALKTWVDYNVPGGVPYIMSPSHLNSFNGYNYVKVFDLNYGDAMNGVPATPVFTQTEMFQDNEITLDFVKDPMITMKFMEDGNETHILHDPMTGIVPYGNDYDPAQSGPPVLLTDSITGKLFTFVGYRLDSTDSSANTYTSSIDDLATLSNVASNHTYRLLYTLATTTLTVSKIVVGQLADLTKQFSFTITLTGSDGVPLAGPLAYTGDPNTGPADGSLVLDGGLGTFSLRDGQGITMLDVPADCSVQIVETPDAGYATAITDSEKALITDPANPGDTGVVDMTINPRTFTFTNTRKVPPDSGVLLGGNSLMLLPALGLLFILAFYLGRREFLRRPGHRSTAGTPVSRRARRAL